RLGGVEDISPGSDNGKDFNVKTQIACQASVFLTQGTSQFGDPGCVVRTLCVPGTGCFATQDPTLINNAVISRLEQASDFIPGSVVLPNDVNRAACAAINCTLGGLADTSSQCMTLTFGIS